ncbi:MAG: hypothetical protein V1859_09985 [archaeon]
MKIESHLENLKESIAEIDEAIKKGITSKQRTIGFHSSAAVVDMMEIYLHKKNFITYDHLIKHEWFLSKKKLSEKIPYDFENKEEILNLIRSIEEKRNTLCYGRRQPEEILEKIILDFNKLKKLFISLGLNEIEELK